MTFAKSALPLILCTSLLGTGASAQSADVDLAVQTFVKACIETQGDAQLARLALARTGEFPKGKRPKGLFGEDLGGRLDTYTHVRGKVTALVSPTRIGKDLCAVGIKKPRNLDATNRAIAEGLAQSPYASSPQVQATKKGRRTMYSVRMGKFVVIVDRSLAGKNSSINIR